jgi:hypothetical protein
MNKKNKANKDGTGTPDKKFNADDDDDDDDASLDELLGSDTATDELFN